MNDDELNLDDLMGHYLNIFKIYNAGDYERENKKICGRQPGE